MVVKVQEKIYDHEEGKPHWYYIDYKYYYIGKKHGKLREIQESYKHPTNPFYGMKMLKWNLKEPLFIKMI